MEAPAGEKVNSVFAQLNFTGMLFTHLFPNGRSSFERIRSRKSSSN
jgi:hypothetical protein